MSILQRTEGNDARTTVLDSVTDGRRRRILDVLCDRSSPMALDNLTAYVASVERGGPSETDGAAIRGTLVHGHLPALEAAGLVEWDREEATVTATDHPALSDPAFLRILEGDGDEWDEILESLANECRSTVVTVLEGRSDPTPRRTLAREVADRDASGEPSQEAVDEILVALHHLHLPKLDDAGLVAYDRDAETVTYRGHPDLDSVLFERCSE